jgi:hypothetical protein
MFMKRGTNLKSMNSDKKFMVSDTLIFRNSGRPLFNLMDISIIVFPLQQINHLTAPLTPKVHPSMWPALTFRSISFADKLPAVLLIRSYK